MYRLSMLSRLGERLVLMVGVPVLKLKIWVCIVATPHEYIPVCV